MAEDTQKRILIIAGDPVLRNSYNIRFARAGFVVWEAVDGAEALESMRDGNVDVILLDLVLPDQDGFKFLEEIKSSPGYASIPVFAMSDLDSSADRERVEALGATGHIVKARDGVEDVLVMVQAALGGHTEREPLVASSAPRMPVDPPVADGADELLGE